MQGGERRGGEAEGSRPRRHFANLWQAQPVPEGSMWDVGTAAGKRKTHPASRSIASTAGTPSMRLSPFQITPVAFRSCQRALCA